jgi:transposase
VLLWVGEDRTEEAVKKFFTEEPGKRRCRMLRAVWVDMWAADMNLVREHAPRPRFCLTDSISSNICKKPSMRYDGARCGA